MIKHLFYRPHVSIYLSLKSQYFYFFPHIKLWVTVNKVEPIIHIPTHCENDSKIRLKLKKIAYSIFIVLKHLTINSWLYIHEFFVSILSLLFNLIDCYFQMCFLQIKLDKLCLLELV